MCLAGWRLLTERVIFLDIDGPMLPARAWIGRTEDSEAPFAPWDPVACKMIESLVVEAKAKLVISSSWASMGRAEFEGHLVLNGLKADDLHDDWMTPREPGTRSDQVHGWLEAHPEVTSWVSFDDARVGGSGAITVSFDDGITLDDYNLARRMFRLGGFMIL